MAPLPCDAITLGLTAITSLVFWAKQAQPAADGAAAAPTATATEAAAGLGDQQGVPGSGGAAAARLAGSILLASTAAAALLLALSFSPRWQRWRAWAVAALRLALFSALPWAPQLRVAPGSWAVDAVRVFQGSRAFRLLFFGIGLPLDLPAHLAVHTLCLFIALADAPRACALPLLSGSVPATRFAIAHILIGSLGTGGMLRYFPPNDPQVQCVAALDTFCLFLGWLVPTYFALRRRHEAAVSRQQQDQQQQSQQQQSQLARGAAAAPAGPAASLQTQGGSLHQNLSGSSCNVSPGPPPARRRLALPSVDASVAWTLENIFLHNALLPETSVFAWWVLATFCWIAGSLLALALATAG